SGLIGILVVVASGIAVVGIVVRGIRIVAVLLAAPASAPAAALLLFRAVILVRLVEFILFLGDVIVFVGFDRDRFELGRGCRPRPAAGDAHLGAFILAFGHDFDGDAVKLLDRGKILALGIEEIDRRLGRGIERDHRALALGRFVLDQS